MASTSRSNVKKESFFNRLGRDIKNNYELYLFVLPAVVIIFIFNYIPMYGVQIAFRDFRPIRGITGSEWVGLDHFIRFFKSPQFENLLKNTLGLSVYGLIMGFPMPILLALMLNQMRSERYKKTVQTVTYMPHFISTVVVVGMMMIMLSPGRGLYGQMMKALGIGHPPNILGDPKWFRSIYILSDIWQHTGWDSIIYLAALASVDISLYEAATVDGANKFQKIRHIDIPSLIPTTIVLLILRLGYVMSVGFEKVFLMQNPLNLPRSEIISTYVYKIGLISAQYSYSAAIGLFNTLVNFILLITVNKIARKHSDVSLW